MDELKKLLGEELYNQLIGKLGDQTVALVPKGKKAFLYEGDTEPIVNDGKSFIPKHRFDEVNNQVKELQKTITKNETDLAQLKKDAKGNEDLTEKITELQNENKTNKEQFAKSELHTRKMYAVKEALMSEGVVDPEARDLLALRFSSEQVDKMEIGEDGKLKGAVDLIKPLKENTTLNSLFGEVKVEGVPPEKKKTLTPDSNGFFTKEQMDNMTVDEVIANQEAVDRSIANLSSNGS